MSVLLGILLLAATIAVIAIYIAGASLVVDKYESLAAKTLR